ncbi:MAG: LamG-like jellyroll fold domain-containing protein [Verrucomicrobiota bacterium]
MLIPPRRTVKRWMAGLALALLLPNVASRGQNSLTNGLVAYWNFDNKDFADSVGTFDGTGNGTEAIPFVDGKAGFGQAIDLDGTDQFVEITGRDPGTYDPDQLAFENGSISIAGWFTVDAFDKSWQALIAKGEGSNWRVARNSASSTMSYAGGLTDVTGTKNVADGSWHHFVAISDANATAFGTALYIDGVLDGTQAGAAVLTANASNVKIGDNPGASGRYWNGKIDDVAIWNRVLSETEIGALYSSGTGKPLSVLINPTSSGTVTITQQPGNVTVLEGAAAQFSVQTTFTGEVPPSYQWRKNGVDIANAVNATYTTPCHRSHR